MRLPIFLFLSFCTTAFLSVGAEPTTPAVSASGDNTAAKSGKKGGADDEEDDTIKGTAKLKASPVPSKKTSEKYVDFTPYIQGLQGRIKGAWDPPRSDKSMRVIAWFKVDRTGNVSGLKLLNPSGNKLADQAAITAVQWASPLRELPPGSPPSVDIQFTFDYNVIGDGSHQFKPYEYSAEREEHIRGMHYVRAGRQAFFLKQYDKAMERYKEAEQYMRPSSKSFLRSFMADALGAKGLTVVATDPEKAASIYRNALSIDPDAEYIALRLQQALAKKGVKSGSCKVREELADEFLQKKDFESALVEYKCALALARTQASEVKGGESAGLRLAAAKIDEKISKTYELRRFYGDEQKWRKFLEVSPNSVEAYVALAIVKERQGDISSAKQILEDGLKKIPGNAQMESELNRLSAVVPQRSNRLASFIANAQKEFVNVEPSANEKEKEPEKESVKGPVKEEKEPSDSKVTKPESRDARPESKDTKSESKDNESSSTVKSSEPTTSPELSEAAKFARDFSDPPREGSSTGHNDNSIAGTFMNVVQKRIKWKWYPPDSSISLRSVAEFSLDRNGKVLTVRLVESAKNKISDEAAIKAVKSASPFPPIPSEIMKLPFEIRFTFDYNRFKDPAKPDEKPPKIPRMKDEEVVAAHIQLAEALHHKYPDDARRTLEAALREFPNNAKIKSELERLGVSKAPIDVVGVYMQLLQAKIKSKWKEPEKPTVVPTSVVFSVDRSGAVSGVRLTRSSGSRVLDEAAIAALKSASPIAPLPRSEFKEDKLDVQFTFAKNVFKGQPANGGTFKKFSQPPPPGVPSAHVRLANALEQRGHSAEAKESLEAALKDFPNNAEIKSQLQKLSVRSSSNK